MLRSGKSRWMALRIFNVPFLGPKGIDFEHFPLARAILEVPYSLSSDA